MRRAICLLPLLALACAPEEPVEPLAVQAKPKAAAEMPAQVRYRNNQDFKNAELVLRQNPNTWTMTDGWSMGAKDGRVSGTWTREGGSIRFEGPIKGHVLKGTLEGNTLSIDDPFVSGYPRPEYPAPFVFHRI